MTKPEKEIETFCPTSQQEWRLWLATNHEAKPGVWLVQYKKSANKPTLSWSEAVDEALCFGWIDSIRKTIDGERFIQFFSKRKAKSAWSKINKANVERLIEQGLMTPAGLQSIETAKQNGSWTVLDEVEEMVMPKDLEKALKTNAEAANFFFGLSKSVRKHMLQWVAFAKRPETRQKRIGEIVELAAQGLKPKQF